MASLPEHEMHPVLRPGLVQLELELQFFWNNLLKPFSCIRLVLPKAFGVIAAFVQHDANSKAEQWNIETYLKETKT